VFKKDWGTKKCIGSRRGGTQLIFQSSDRAQSQNQTARKGGVAFSENGGRNRKRGGKKEPTQTQLLERCVKRKRRKEGRKTSRENILKMHQHTNDPPGTRGGGQPQEGVKTPGGADTETSASETNTAGHPPGFVTSQSCRNLIISTGGVER